MLYYLWIRTYKALVQLMEKVIAEIRRAGLQPEIIYGYILRQCHTVPSLFIHSTNPSATPIETATEFTHIAHPGHPFIQPTQPY